MASCSRGSRRRFPPSRGGSIFQRIFAGSAGIDPYASAVSDVYQDLFQEGSFTGKGIYDVDAFEAAMKDRVPENTLLSHDLFEGVFARAGLVTNVELFDEFPSNYLVSATRQHRWARGDWQLLPWILDQARDASGSREPELHPRHRPMEDDRQPAPHPLGAAHGGDARGGVDAAVGLHRLVDSVRRGNGGRAGGPARADGSAAAAQGHLQAQPPPSRRRRHPHRRRTCGARHHLRSPTRRG